VAGGVWKKCEKLLKKRSPNIPANIPASPPPETNFSLRPSGGRKIHKFALGAKMASYGPVNLKCLLSNQNQISKPN
jgi:hypothetical protein